MASMMLLICMLPLYRLDTQVGARRAARLLWQLGVEGSIALAMGCMDGLRG